MRTSVLALSTPPHKFFRAWARRNYDAKGNVVTEILNMRQTGWREVIEEHEVGICDYVYP